MTNNSKILILDPDPDIRMTFEYALGRAGFQAIAVKDADEGLRICLAERPRIVLSEVSLSGMDCYELCGKIKGEPVTRESTKFIIMSSHSANEVLVKGPEVCADYYIPKPVNPADVLADIQRLIEGNFQLSPMSLELLRVAKRIPTHREAITPGYSNSSKKVVHIHPPSVKFGDVSESHGKKPSSSRGATAVLSKPRDEKLIQVNELLKSLVASFRQTQQSLQAVVRYIDNKPESPHSSN